MSSRDEHPVEIAELAIPATLDLPGAADFVQAIHVRNAVESAGYGFAELTFTPAEIHPGWQNPEHEPKRMIVGRVDGVIVARGVLEWRPGPDADTGWGIVEVLPEFRMRGIGTAIADRLEHDARELGLDRIIVYVVSPPAEGPVLESPTGFGGVPRENPEVRFLLGRGYSLEQVERGSRLALPAPGIPSIVAEFGERAGSNYRLHSWEGATPPERLEGIAFLLTRMSTDAPVAELDEPEDPWSVERLVADDAVRAASPRPKLVTAVEHVPSGMLVGFTMLTASPDPARAASQEDTIVVTEHRGHGLGMLLKAANLAFLAERYPEQRSIITFNAEENRHMLRVNEALGFTVIGYEGAWKKALAR